MRCFFALEPKPATRRAIAEWRERAFPPLPRPVRPDNLHLTLAFVGELEPARLERLFEGVSSALDAEQPAPEPIHLDTVGYWASPGLLWLGPSATPPALADLAQLLRQVSQRLGRHREQQPFRPHVTLFRGCDVPPPAPACTPDVTMPFDTVTLFESRRGRNGIVYIPLSDWPLFAH